MLTYKLLQSGIPNMQIQAFAQDVASGLTATGANQATAYATDATVSAFSTVAAGTGARLTSNAVPGDTQSIHNGGANDLAVYPPVGGQINALGTNNAFTVAVGKGGRFEMATSSQWMGFLTS